MATRGQGKSSTRIQAGTRGINLRELKVIRSHNFYPSHYLNEVFADDVQGVNVSGEDLLRTRHGLRADLAFVGESNHSGETVNEASETIAHEVFGALGYYKVDAVAGDQVFDFEVERSGRTSRSLSVQAERRIALRDGSELWLFVELGCTLKESVAENILDSKCSAVKSNDDDLNESWRTFLDKAFHSDRLDVNWIIVNTGRALVLFERNRWIEEDEAWLEANLVGMWDLNSIAYARMVEVLFAPGAFPIESPEHWHQIIQTSAHKKASEVSKALRDTVRESVELLANTVLEHHAKTPIAAWKNVDFKDTQTRDRCAQEVFEQVLRVIYRMLFILVAEGQSQAKKALPLESMAYENGLALEKLRDLAEVPLVEGSGTQGSFIWETLKKQSDIYFRGYNAQHRRPNSNDEGGTDALGFAFPPLGIDLFNQASTPLLNDVKFTDQRMKEVLLKLSLAQTGSGSSRRTHRVYYGSLSLNRLGEVYEGLLSLRPHILSERMYVLQQGDKEHAPMLVSEEKASKLEAKMFALDSNGRKQTRQTGEFALTPTGFERKLTASYYTPEELTKFLASEAVECLLGKEMRAKDAQELCTRIPKIENLKICEPAMGNGAFCNAVIDELASRLAKLYVRRAELAAIEPAKFSLSETEAMCDLSAQKGRAREHILRHGVYGVDLNPTAVELARVSLWLNALHKGCDLPYLDLKLRCGNSLVGGWVKKHRVAAGNTPHFLFQMPAMLDSHFDGKFLGDNKRGFLSGDLKEYARELRDCVATVARQREKLTDKALSDRLKALTAKIDDLYATHHEKRTKLQAELARDFDLSPAQREHKAKAFLQDDTEYNQLRGMMDLWCSLWFWPHSELGEFPDPHEFLQAMEFYAETPVAYDSNVLVKQFSASGLTFLLTARKVALRERFFHWDLEFPEIFERGGFDLVLGNPPWAQVKWEEGDFFDAFEFGISQSAGDAGTRVTLYDALLASLPKGVELYKNAWCDRAGYAVFLNSSQTYDYKDSSTTNTYKFFYQRFLDVTRSQGIHAMIAQDGLLTDNGNAESRPTFYSELVRGFRFLNEIQLFAEIDHHVNYFVWISKRNRQAIDFEFIDNLYHPETVRSCRQESQRAPYRGMKDERGRFELRGHPKRIVHINKEKLGCLAQLIGAKSPTDVPLPVIHGEVELTILEKFALAPEKMEFGENTIFSYLFHETSSPREGLIRKNPQHGHGLARSVLTGPNLFVATPAYKEPNPGCRNNLDYSQVDLTTIPDDYFPHTLYEITDKGLKSDRYNRQTPWGERELDHFRLAGRKMVSTTGARTLCVAIIPPEVAHTDGIVSISFSNSSSLLQAAGLWTSLTLDFLTRSMSGGNCNQKMLSVFPQFPNIQKDSDLAKLLISRSLRLNCISAHYRYFWASEWSENLKTTGLPSEFEPTLPYSKLTKRWTRDSAIRDPKQREQALCEIDAVVAILFGIPKQELLELYRSQFGVLQKNLQDLPNQEPDSSKYHFPRYQAMSDAYDACMSRLLGKGPSSPPKSLAKNHLPAVRKIS